MACSILSDEVDPASVDGLLQACRKTADASGYFLLCVPCCGHDPSEMMVRDFVTIDSTAQLLMQTRLSSILTSSLTNGLQLASPLWIHVLLQAWPQFFCTSRIGGQHDVSRLLRLVRAFRKKQQLKAAHPGQ